MRRKALLNAADCQSVHCQPIARGGQRGYGRKLLPQDLRGFLLPFIPRPSQSNNKRTNPQPFDKLQRASLQIKSGKHCSMVPQYTQKVVCQAAGLPATPHAEFSENFERSNSTSQGPCTPS